MTCSHVHPMSFDNDVIKCLGIEQYQFTGRDMPLQKSSRVAILVSLQECGVFLHITVHRETNPEKPKVQIGCIILL